MTIHEIEQFFDRSLRGLVRGHVTCCGREFEYRQWDGEELSSRLIAIDTETELVQEGKVPRLAVAQAFDGETCYLVHPSDVASFIEIHSSFNFVGHNVAGFDFLVIYRHLLKQCNNRNAARVWMSVADDGRLADTMLLDQLVQIGDGSDHPFCRNLAKAAEKRCNISGIDKDDIWRRRYGELIGVDWRTVDRAAWEYAAKDAVVTRYLFLELRNQGRRLVRTHRIKQSVVQVFGSLSLRIQVQAAIAFAAIENRGIHVDQSRRQSLEEMLRREIDNLVRELKLIPEFAGVFKFDKNAQQLFSPTGKPRISQKRMREILEELADEHEIESKRTSKGAISLSRSFWNQHAEAAPFISMWTQLEEKCKLLQFFKELQTDRIHPRYTVLVRTGRTSCSSPNIQQIPRTSAFRELFVARPNHLFIVIDYAALELRTLAAVCERRFGKSVLADTIRAGRDPHAYTASLLAGMSFDEFMQLRETDIKSFKKKRQAAKAINFGVPAGLGPESLSQYAKLQYGVALSVEEAAEFRERLLTEIYPEIGRFMADDIFEVVAANLGIPRGRLQSVFRCESLLLAAKRIVAGHVLKKNGDAYSKRFISRVWDDLYELNKNTSLENDLCDRRASVSLERRLFFGIVVTATGRPRGGSTFTQRKNIQFQGLAADGAKIALWNLFRANFKIVAFVHDEFVIEISENCDYTKTAKRIEQICCQSMEQVTGDVPIECEYALTRTWSKDAEAVHDEHGELCIWEPAAVDQSASPPVATTVRTEKKVVPVATSARKEISTVPVFSHNSSEIYLGDCRELIPHLGKFDFIFADPPFNIGHGYEGYDDNLSEPEFAQLIEQFTALCWEACDGVMALHGPDALVRLWIGMEDRLGLKGKSIAWVNWHYRFGQCGRSNWIDARCHCLIYAKNPTFTWNPDSVLVPSDRATEYNDKRIHETENGGMRLPGTIGGVPSDGKYWGRVTGNNQERCRKHPNQLPEVYLERLIKAYTNPGDRVFDPFCGSGTTAVVADTLGRRSVTCDISGENVESASERLKQGAVRVDRTEDGND